ncbi:MAG TPA: T9SS type A sorting domain-containing protein [Fluviicola sp.]|nr:T9SS type A sorting domain-containing protein [Fluviicola sp.]
MKTLLLFAFALLSSVSLGQDSLYTKVFYDGGQGLQGQTSCLSFEDGLLIVSKVSDGANVLLIDSVGNPLWSVNLGYTNNMPDFYFNEAIRTIDSCFLLAGTAYNHNDSQYEGYLVKLNQTGDTVWTRTLTTNSMGAMPYDESTIYSVVQDADSSFAFVGTAGNLGSNWGQRMFTGKIDFNGDLVWSNVYEAFNYSVKPINILTGPGNNYFIAGQLFDPSNTNLCTGLLAEMSETGNLVWSKKIHSLKINDAIIRDSALFFIAESEQPGQTFLFKTDLSGNALWNNLYNWNGSGMEKTLQVTPLADDLLIYDAYDIGMGSSMYKVDTTGNILASTYLMLGAMNIFERSNQGIYIVGVGPMIGIRADVYQPQVGIIKTDSLFQQSLCIEQSFPLNMLNVPTIIDTLYSFTVVDTLIPRSIGTTSNAYTLYSFEGCVSYLDDLTELNSLNLSVYPNSSTGIFTLEQESPETLYISIVDSQGKLILKQQLNGYTDTIDLSQQADGIYFYKAVSSDNRMKTGKLVIVK